MNTTDKLKLLLSACKAGVSIDVNEHRNVHQSAEAALLEESEWDGERISDIEPHVRQGMIETDTIVAIQFYPTTPVGFYRILHHDIDAALDEALECLRQEGLLS